MKYGGMGGWKAVKRFNRDAHIASGRSPHRGQQRIQEPQSIGPLGIIFLSIAVLIVLVPLLLWEIFKIAFKWMAKRETEPCKALSPDMPTLAENRSATRNISVKCIATTKKGVRCCNSAVQGGRCHRHQP
jgi:hypothetical protein